MGGTLGTSAASLDRPVAKNPARSQDHLINVRATFAQIAPAGNLPHDLWIQHNSAGEQSRDQTDSLGFFQQTAARSCCCSRSPKWASDGRRCFRRGRSCREVSPGPRQTRRPGSLAVRTQLSGAGRRWPLGAHPWKPTSVFQDSLSCLNFNEPERPHPCNECLLCDLAPREFNAGRISLMRRTAFGWLLEVRLIPKPYFRF
jgi:hypothetical protein